MLVRFTVGEDGRVSAAEVAEPCQWPLLNRSAVRAIRERWRFERGPLRQYEVAVVFKLDGP